MKPEEIVMHLRRLSGQGTEYRKSVCRLAAQTIEDQQKKIRELEQKLQEVPGQQSLEI